MTSNDSTGSFHPSDSDARVGAIVATYLRALESGQPIAREALMAQYPEFAEELDAFFTDHDRLEHLAKPLRMGATDPVIVGGIGSANGTGTTIRYFGDYELLEEIAAGGMGVVYKARQVSLNRPVAVKMILVGHLATESDVKRFQAEAEAAANLRHPGVVAIYEVGVHQGQHFYSMEYVEGRNLSQIIRDPAAPGLPAAKAAEYVRDMAEIVQYAHQQGVLHRDLKPSNVMIDTADRVCITDFGLAKRVGGDSDLTITGQVIGTPSYMSPEQAAAQHTLIGPTSDVYALGAILYELVTGRPPFRSDSAVETLRQVQQDEPVRPRLLSPQLPIDLETICLKCLEKESRRRYSSAQDFADELGRFLRGEPIQARPVSRFQRAWRWSRRQPVVASLSAAVILALVTGVVASSYFAVGEHFARLREEGLAADNLALANNERILRRQAEYQTVRVKFEQAWSQYEQGRVAEALVLLAGLLATLDRPAEAPGALDGPLRESVALSRALRNQLQAIAREASCPLISLTHGERILDLAFSPDGTKLATASSDKTARLWDAATGKPLVQPLEHQREVISVAFSPDGTKLATASDKTARLWDVATGKPLAQPLEHNGPVFSVAFSPDGLKLATASYDKTARLWDVATGKPLAQPLVHEGQVWPVAFSPDGTKLATASDKTARLWDVATGKPLAQPLEHKRRVRSVAFSPDGTKLATASWDNTARLWEVATGKPLAQPLVHNGEVNSAAFSLDGTKLATASRDKTARLWDVATGKPLAQPLEHQDAVRSVAFSPDGTKLATASSDKTARLWDAATGKPLVQPLEHQREVISVAFSPDGTKLATASYDKSARLWKVATGKPLAQPLVHNGEVYSVAFSPDGTKLATASWDNTARLWDVATGKPLAQPLGHKGSVWSVAFSPDGTKLATASDDKTARLWDVATGKPLAQPLKHEGRVLSVAFSPDGTMLATASWDKTARLWDVATGKPLAQPLEHNGEVHSVAFSPDGTKLATASDDKTARLWDVATGKPLAQPLKHNMRVFSVAFSLDGTKLATSSWDKTARLWDVATGKPLAQPLKHEGRVLSVAFSPDGTKLATASDDNTARLWEVATGKPLAQPLEHKSWVRSVAFSPDGTKLATASWDKTARLWDVATGKPLAQPLEHQDAVRSVAFSPDGTKLATACADKSVRVWDLDPRPTEPAEQLVLWASTLTGLVAEADGTVRVLTPDEMADCRASLDRMGGPPKAYLAALARRRHAPPAKPKPPEP